MIKLRYKPLKTGKYSIYLDIYSADEQGNRKRQYEFLKLQVSKDYSKIKNVLTEDRNYVDLAEGIRSKRELELVGDIKGLKVRQKTTLLSFKDFLTKYQRKNNDFRIKSLQFHLNNFTQASDLLFVDITTEWLIRFQEYLSLVVSHNTVYNYLKMLRARLNDALRQDIITINPFDKFEMPRCYEVKRTTLDYEEVQKLIDTPFPSHPHVRLAFLFSCYTGLRVSDVENLKWKDITEVKDKKASETIHYLSIMPVKTKNTSGKILQVPITDSAIAILKDIKNEKSKSEKVFYNLPTGRNTRNLIKIWGAKAGIKKNMHFHIARHTFATISLTYGIDIYTVSKLLGHQSLRNTEVYAKIVDEKKRLEIQKLPLL